MEWSQLVQLAQIAYKTHHDGSVPKQWDDINDWEQEDWVRTVRAVLRQCERDGRRMRDIDRTDQRDDILSACHDAPMDTTLADGVLVGSCRECGYNVVRVNPRTGVEEYLDGASPWVYASLRPTGRQK